MPFEDEIKKRYDYTQKWMRRLDETEGGLANFSKVSSMRVKKRRKGADVPLAMDYMTVLLLCTSYEVYVTRGN